MSANARLTEQTIRDALKRVKDANPPPALQYVMNERDYTAIYGGLARLANINAALLAALEKLAERAAKGEIRQSDLAQARATIRKARAT